MRSVKKAFIVLPIYGIIIVLLVVKKYGDQYLNWTPVIHSPTNKSVPGYVTMKRFEGRLGNQMFQFAALFFVALKTNREVVLFSNHETHDLEEYFSLEVRKVEKSCPCFLFEEHLSSYDYRIEEAIRSEIATNSRTILLFGYLQSWKYIEPVEHLLRTHLKFRSSTETFARDILRQTIPNGWTEGRFIRVGIHNRRGDFLQIRYIFHGFTTAPESYFKKAMKYFTDRYKFVQFIVVSDDINWCREHITYDKQTSSVNVTYSEKHSPGQDMAILSLCDHVIISSGTFGWMSAWLANGTTVYYSKFPRKRSCLAYTINRLDYYPPHWIPME